MTRRHQLAGGVQADHLRRTYCGRLLFLRSQAVLKMSCRQRWHEVHLNNEMNGCQGTQWNGELDGKEFHGALGGECDLKSKGSAVFWTLSTWSTHPSISTTSVV